MYTCEKFGGCKNLFSWLSQKVNKIDKIDDTDDSDFGLCPWPQDDTASWQDILTPFSILIESEATKYLYSKFQEYLIRVNFQIHP